MTKQLLNDLKLRVRWLFNGPMVAAAISGWLIFGGLADIVNTMRHTGPGVVDYEYYGPEEVSESTFKQHNYRIIVPLILLGVIIWTSFALGAKEERAAIRDNLLRIVAEARVRESFQHQSKSVLDEQTLKRAEDECLRVMSKWEFHAQAVLHGKWVPEWLKEPLTDDEKSHLKYHLEHYF